MRPTVISDETYMSLVLDGRHCLDPERLAKLGYRYLSVTGR